MPNIRHLTNAPITEAIIHYRVKARPGFNPEEFSGLHAKLKDRFPTVEAHRGVEFTIQLGPTPAVSTAAPVEAVQGYVFKSADGKTIAQLRLDGFSLNRLKPYTRWEDLFPIAMELWDAYATLAQPETVTQLSVRNINRVALPGPTFSFADFIHSAPPIPPGLPDAVSSFLTRVTIHETAENLAAHIVQAVERSRPTEPSLLLDINAYRDGQFAIDDPMIRTVLGKLHDFKNLIFFSTLTDECLRKYE